MPQAIQLDNFSASDPQRSKGLSPTAFGPTVFESLLGRGRDIPQSKPIAAERQPAKATEISPEQKAAEAVRDDEGPSASREKSSKADGAANAKAEKRDAARRNARRQSDDSAADVDTAVQKDSPSEIDAIAESPTEPAAELDDETAVEKPTKAPGDSKEKSATDAAALLASLGAIAQTRVVTAKTEDDAASPPEAGDEKPVDVNEAAAAGVKAAAEALVAGGTKATAEATTAQLQQADANVGDGSDAKVTAIEEEGEEQGADGEGDKKSGQDESLGIEKALDHLLSKNSRAETGATSTDNLPHAQKGGHRDAVSQAMGALKSIDGQEEKPTSADDAKAAKAKAIADTAGADAGVKTPPGDPASPSVVGVQAKPGESSSPSSAIPILPNSVQPAVQDPAAMKPQALPQTPQAQFAEDNHTNIVQSIKSTVLPTGGTMHIRLDPPELGALQVRLNMRDGVMTAEFQTSNDQATQLLSHSLAQLKNSLQQQGVTIDRIQVQQTPKDSSAQNNADDRSGSQQQKFAASDQGEARREEQRKEALQRMWARMAMGEDPLDMVA